MIRITNPKGETQVHTEESYEKLLWQFAESKMMDMWCRKHHLIPYLYAPGRNHTQQNGSRGIFGSV